MKMFLTDSGEVRKSIIIFYIVGCIGMVIPALLPYFIMLIPYVLLFHFALVVYFHQTYSISKTIQTIVLFLFIFVSSMAVEIIGVHTGTLFGTYSYGSGLGIKFMSVPLLIGVNWMFMVYASASVVDVLPVPDWLKTLSGAGLMVLYDLVLEHVAPIMDMWEFAHNSVPIQNYIMWFMCALVFHALLRIMKIRIQNSIVKTVFVSQFFFFISIMLIYRYII
ncbi:MAG: carotenoid biosynthesis protein [Bacteroidales bacterium]